MSKLDIELIKWLGLLNPPITRAAEDKNTIVGDRRGCLIKVNNYKEVNDFS